MYTVGSEKGVGGGRVRDAVSSVPSLDPVVFFKKERELGTVLEVALLEHNICYHTIQQHKKIHNRANPSSPGFPP